MIFIIYILVILWVLFITLSLWMTVGIAVMIDNNDVDVHRFERKEKSLLYRTLTFVGRIIVYNSYKDLEDGK